MVCSLSILRPITLKSKYFISTQYRLRTSETAVSCMVDLKPLRLVTSGNWEISDTDIRSRESTQFGC